MAVAADAESARLVNVNAESAESARMSKIGQKSVGRCYVEIVREWGTIESESKL